MPERRFLHASDCRALGKSPLDLFGVSDARRAGDHAAGFTAVSHKFIPVFVGAETASVLAEAGGFRGSSCEWMSTRVVELPTATDNSCTATMFDFGVLVYHMSEERRLIPSPSSRSGDGQLTPPRGNGSATWSQPDGRRSLSGHNMYCRCTGWPSIAGRRIV